MSAEKPPIRDRVPGDRTLEVDALVGAVVAVVLSFVPFSPVLGGAVAGYLHRDRGPRVGGLSGLFASVPIAVILVVVLFVFGLLVPVAPDGNPARGLVLFLLFVLFAALFVTAVNVVLGAAGGVLGVALAEREERRRRVSGEHTIPSGQSRSDDDVP